MKTSLTAFWGSFNSGELVQRGNNAHLPASLVGSWMVETGGDQDQASKYGQNQVHRIFRAF